MRYAYKISISFELFDYENYENYINEIKKEARSKKEKGKKLIFLRTVIGLDRDDFIRNLVTVISYYNCYKKPRFIK